MARRAYRIGQSSVLQSCLGSSIDVSGSGAEPSRLLEFQFLHDGPEEADEFSGHGDGRDARGLPDHDAMVKLVEMMLSLPCVAYDRRWLGTRPSYAMS